MIGYTELTGDLKSALRSVEIFNRAYPQLEIATNEQRVMLEYLLGRHDNAYPDAVIAVEAAGAAGGEKPLLQLALTSASKGWVFPGQLDYCVRMLRESLGDRFPQRLIDLPKWDARKPRDVEEAACLALGAQNRQVSWAFLQRAHIINPSDSLAMRILVQVYEFDGQFSAARAAAREALRRSVDDEARRWFERELLNDASLPDRPYPRPSSGASDSR